jgi:hypothetical protein
LAAARLILAVSGVIDSQRSALDEERSAKRVGAIFKVAGVAKDFEHKWAPEGHRFYQSLMWPVVDKAMKK